MVGALRYVSHNVHAYKEQARRDDLESWLFLSLEFFDLKCLPWREDLVMSNVLHKKKKLIEGACKCLPSLRSSHSRLDPMTFASSSLRFKTILEYVAKMKYNERPDYAHIHKALQEIRAERRLDFDLPYDWEVCSERESAFTSLVCRT